MTAKEYLNQLRDKRHIIQAEQAKLEELERVKYDIKAVTYNVGNKSSDITDTVADTVARIDAIQRRIQKQIQEYLDLFEKVTKQIDEIEKPAYREILILRYVKGIKWEEINYYSQQHSRRLNTAALAQFTALHPEIEKL
jgi:gas vesicle protein